MHLFEQYCQINEFPLAYLPIAQHIEKNPSQHLEIFHPRAYIFDAWQEYVQNNRTQESFVRVSDVDGDVPLYREIENNPGLSSVHYVFDRLIAKKYTDTCFVFHVFARTYFLHQGGEEEVFRQFCEYGGNEFFVVR